MERGVPVSLVHGHGKREYVQQECERQLDGDVYEMKMRQRPAQLHREHALLAWWHENGWKGGLDHREPSREHLRGAGRLSCGRQCGDLFHGGGPHGEPGEKRKFRKCEVGSRELVWELQQDDQLAKHGHVQCAGGPEHVLH